MIGKSFSHYKVIEKIGEGGMGQVYLAQDSTLRRQVAIKVLPPNLLDDVERLARFEREAQVLASLNHPNIAAVYGLEESDGNRCLIMELVEGEDLAQRLERGAISPEETLLVARQVADALEAAHESGIVHRDLKPANIKLPPDGRVKVLDFGLAKAVEGDPSESNPSMSASPTLTGMMTGANVILGTAAYMSPEQARGQVVDKRSDIWAYGCVLFELLSGRQAFQGDTISDTLASVLKSEPEWSALPPTTPTHLRQLMERCLIKDPLQRLRDIGEARILLDAGEPETHTVTESAPPARRGTPVWIMGVLAALVVVAAGLTWVLKPTPPQETTQGAILLPEGFGLMLGSGGHLAFSPDGRRIAFAAQDSTGVSSLWIRNLTDASSHQLSGTDDAINPFWSPDGEQLGFFADGKLKKIPVSGGAPIAVCNASNGRGGSWQPDGTIAFSPHFNAGLVEVSASGGEPTPLVELQAGNFSYRWPQRLPGKGLFYTTIRSGGSDDAILYQPDGDTARSLVATESQGVFEDGLLFYVIDDVLFARPFSPDTYTFTGDPQTIATDVHVSSNFSRAAFTMAGGQHIAYVSSSASSATDRLVQHARDGTVVKLRDLGGAASDPALSPDSTRVAFSKVDPDAGGGDVWVLDLNRDVQTRLTFSGTADDVVWSPDGKRLAYSSDGNIHVKLASGVGEEVAITESVPNDCTHDWSPDGRYLVWSRSGDHLELWVYDFKEKKERLLLKGDHNYAQGQFSPNGRWIAYVSSESGQSQIYVQDFPDLSGRWQISGGGGTYPQWRRDGREIVYRAGDRSFVAVGVDSEGDALRIGQQQTLFSGNLTADRSIQMCLSPDGQSIWLLEPVDADVRSGSTPIRFILNWQQK